MRRLVTTLLCIAGVSLFAGSAMAQVWKYPPGPPYRTCPDTLNIYDIQQTDTLLAPCAAATLDTVWGVKGVIVGMDTKASAYGFYIQTPGGGPRTGVLVFTGATNYASLGYAVGDYVAVYGTTQEFPNPNGETEIEGPDRSQSTNDLIVRKISSGNPLPMDVVTTPQVNWVPALSQGEEWEGGLIKIRGPLRVARNSGNPALGSSSFLVVHTGNTLDSVLVDGFNLTTFAAPAVGTIIDSIVGIPTQRTVLGTNSYRIQIRDGNDVFLAAPPNLVDAYPIEDNVLRLQFDRNVDVATAQNPGNYSLASGIDGSTVDAAVVEGGSGRFVQLTITSVLNDGDTETVSAVNIGSSGCPSCLMTQQNRTFANGVLSIADVQAPDAVFLPSFDDRSRFAGAGTSAGIRLSFRGVCTGAYPTLYAMQDEAGGPRSGIYVFGPSAPMVPGRKYLFVGQVQEFFNLTEGVNNVHLVDEGPGTMPAPVVLPVATLRDTTTDQTQSVVNGEDYEGALVKASYVRITENRNVGQSFFVAGNPGVYADTILVQNLNGALTGYDSPDSATTLSVTGTMNFAFGTWRIAPRGASDIVEHGLNVGVPAAGSALDFAVAPNPARAPRLTFSLPARGDVEIAVFDLQGRRVAQLARGNYAAGVHAIDWDGRDAGGRQVGPGVYFYNFRTGSDVRTVRGVILQ